MLRPKNLDEITFLDRLSWTEMLADESDSDPDETSPTIRVPTSKVKKSRRRGGAVVWVIIIMMLGLMGFGVFQYLKDEKKSKSDAKDAQEERDLLETRLAKVESFLETLSSLEKDVTEMKDRITTIEERLGTEATTDELREELAVATEKLEQTSLDFNEQKNETLMEARTLIDQGLNDTKHLAEVTINERSAVVVDALAAELTQQKDHGIQELTFLTTQSVDEVEAAALEANRTAELARQHVLQVAATAVQTVDEAETEKDRTLERMNNTAKKALDSFLRSVDIAAEQVEKSQEDVHKLESEISKRSQELETLKDSVNSYESNTDSRFEKQNVILRAWVAGFFALLAAILTIRHVYSHVTHMAQPDAQRKVLAILWMVPIYALTSWFSIIFPSVEDELQLVSSFYEAYVVHMFFALLVAILSDTGDEVDALTELPSSLKAPFCSNLLCCDAGGCSAMIPASTFLRRCKIATLQFVVFKPILAVLQFVFDRTHRFREGKLTDYSNPTLWITLLLNLSVSLALAALFAFFHATQQSPRLIKHKPWPKFLAIKGVVFLTWFQQVAITIAIHWKLGALASERLASAFQNFLICVEMFVAATLHAHIFGSDEWQPNYVPVDINYSVADNLALNDFVKDVKSVLPVRRSRRGRKKSKDDDDNSKELSPRADDSAAAEKGNLSPLPEDVSPTSSPTADVDDDDHSTTWSHRRRQDGGFLALPCDDGPPSSSGKRGTPPPPSSRHPTREAEMINMSRLVSPKSDDNLLMPPESPSSRRDKDFV